MNKENKACIASRAGQGRASGSSFPSQIKPMTEGVTKAEAIQAIPEPALSRFFNTIEAADDAYVLSRPPMSPLTKNYFNCWLLFDITAGLNKETLTTIIIDLTNQVGIHKAMIEVMQTMQDSRMGIYEFMGRQGNKILLRELTGNEVIASICPASYRGTHQGETIFQSYVNYKPDVNYLQGLPEVSSSKPHNTNVPKFVSLLTNSPLS